MRITPGMIGNHLVLSLQNALATLASQRDHISSGRRILTPSDDPGGVAQTLILRSRETATAQFQKNVSEATSSLQSADAALQSIMETITRAKEAAVQGASDTNDVLARKAIGSQVNQLLEGLVVQANSRGGSGTFLFGGQESSTAPYTVTRDASGQITAVTVNPRGIDGRTPTEAAEGVTVDTAVSGTSVFGAPTDPTYVFDVLIRLRDNLNANAVAPFQTLGLNADVGATGAANLNAYLGIDAATDLQITGPSGTAPIGLTSAASDTVSAVGNVTSAIATAAAINTASRTTGVTGTATGAQYTLGGAFGADVNIDGSTGHALVVNGTAITVNLTGGSPAARRDALVVAINAQVGGVTAAPSGAAGLALTAADGRNISIQTDATVGAGTVNGEVFGFTTGLATETVVARGSVKLTSTGGSFTTTPAAGAAFSSQTTGTGLANGIRPALDELDAVLDRATTTSTLIGVRLAWLDMVNDRLSGDAVGTAATRSRIEDLDLPKAIQEFQQTQNAYQAALASGAKLLDVSLLNFLK